jgi:hypothetical protein
VTAIQPSTPTLRRRPWKRILLRLANRLSDKPPGRAQDNLDIFV